jgi:methylated-DNA-[protein]-cysteine S-methyltransferase
VLLQAAIELDAYFEGQGFNFSIPLDMAYGTAFQQQVWKCLREIPTGGTTTYGAISQRLGNPNAVRAVGGAVGRNPIGIIVPCHRVIGASGALTGYAGGLDRKIALLTLEGIDLPAHLHPASHPTTGSLF